MGESHPPLLITALKCGEIIQKLTNLICCHTVSPHLGAGWGSKPYKPSYGFKYDHKHITASHKYLTKLSRPTRSILGFAQQPYPKYVESSELGK